MLCLGGVSEILFCSVKVVSIANAQAIHCVPLKYLVSLVDDSRLNICRNPSYQLGHRILTLIFLQVTNCVCNVEFVFSNYPSRRAQPENIVGNSKLCIATML